LAAEKGARLIGWIGSGRFWTELPSSMVMRLRRLRSRRSAASGESGWNSAVGLYGRSSPGADHECLGKADGHTFVRLEIGEVDDGEAEVGRRRRAGGRAEHLHLDEAAELGGVEELGDGALHTDEIAEVHVVVVEVEDEDALGGGRIGIGVGVLLLYEEAAQRR
jgi:hypothetical protein